MQIATKHVFVQRIFMDYTAPLVFDQACTACCTMCVLKSQYLNRFWLRRRRFVGLHAAAVVSESVRQQILAKQRQEENAEAAPEMTLVQAAAVQRDIASILLPGETVTKGLQRLGVHNKRPAGDMSSAQIASTAHKAASYTA